MTDLDHSAQLALSIAASQPKPATLPERQRAYLLDFADVQRPLEEVAEDRTLHLGALRLRLWRGRRAPEQDAPALLYLHGGGWALGAPETHEDICRALANRAGAVVVSPDYRLAPEHPFPAAIEDCTAALRHMAEQSQALGIDPARIIVGGDSAGGNLAAAIALMARDGDVPPVLAQLLIYPVTDQRQDGESFRLYGEGYGLTTADMVAFRQHYLPDPTDWADWRAAPLRHPSLAGVAPAFVVLAGQDVLFSEGAAYAARLAAESRATQQIWPGQIHGFLSKSLIIPEAVAAWDALAAAWRSLDPGLAA